MKSVKYLVDLQAKAGLNDAATARLLNLTHGAISHYKSGRRVMDDETCLAVAMHLNVNPMEIVGAACIDRAEKTGQKSLWEVFMSRTAATAAALALTTSAVTLFLTPGKAEARTYGPASTQTTGTVCIMSNSIGFEADIVGPHWFSKSCSDFAQIIPAP